MRKLKPCLKPFIGCVHCGYGEMIRDPKTRIITCCLNEKMGGDWTVYRNGKKYYYKLDAYETEENYDECLSLAQIDQIVESTNPKLDWRAVYYGGLRDATYQRQGNGRWVLVKSGMGYA